MNGTTVDSPELQRFSDAAMPYRRQMAERLAQSGGAWHLARAQALGVSIVDRIASCGSRTLHLVDEDGVCTERPLGCGQRACPECSPRWARRWAARLRAVIMAHEGIQRSQGRRPALLTLTVRDTGDVDADRRTLTRAWQRWRAWWHGRFGWAFSFVWVWEITAGKQGQGHVHAHVVAWLPVWWSWAKGQAAWSRACGERGGNVDVQVRGDSGSVGQSVQYCVSYLSKLAGIDTLSSELAAEWWSACYGKRAVSVSSGFWAVVGPRDRPTYLEIRIDGQGPDPARRRWWTFDINAADNVNDVDTS